MLVKTDDQKLNMLNITKRKLMTLANGAECLSTKIDNWVTSRPTNNYRKLRSSRISKSCQTMIDHPTPLSKSPYWSYEDTVLLENWIAEKPEPIEEENNEVTTEEELENDIPEIEEPHFNSFDENILFNTSKVNIIQPIIRMDGDIIEIEYCCDDNVDNDNGDDNINNHHFHNVCNSDDNNAKLEQQIKFLNKDYNSKHNTPKIPANKIADNRGLSPRHCLNYRDFLVKQEENNNLPDFNDQISNEETDSKLYDNDSSRTKNAYETKNSGFDEHRFLSQLTPEPHIGQNNNLFKHEKSVMFERGGSTRIRSLNKDVKSEIKSFLSFRCPNKNKKLEKKIRKKYVTSEEGAAGPIWPAVLLTYDRGVSPGPPDSNPDE